MDTLTVLGVVIGLLIVVVAVLWLALFRGPAGNRETIPELKWDPANVRASLESVLANVEAAARSATSWYWVHKAPRARASQFIRATAVFLGALAGLVPVALELLRSWSQTPGQNAPLPWWASGLWASVMLGIAAFLVSLDTAFGFSSGWARYVLAATEITRRLAEFRMDWLGLMAGIPSTVDPTPEQIAALIQKAKDFRLGVEGVVVQETKDWVTAFQSNLAQLEKDLKAQMDTLTAQSQTRQKEVEAATQPGTLEVMIPNANKAHNFTVLVSLRGPNGAIAADDKLVNSQTWVRLGLRPGQYELTVAGDMPVPAAVDASAGGGAEAPAAAFATRRASTVIVLKPGEQFKASLAIPE